MYKTALLKKNDYINIKKILSEGFDLLGGISNFIKTSDKILLKPNFLKPALPDSAVITHPEIIKAMVELIIDCNAIPLIGESPGQSTADKIIKILKLDTFFKKNNVKLVDSINKTKKIKKINNRIIKFDLIKGIDEADKIFSLAKLKTHGMMYYTGAIKNLFGLIPGGLKPELHFKFKNYEQFGQMLVDLHNIVNPSFSIIDGITAMEGNGPGSGTPKNLNCIIMSQNALAADFCAVKIINYEPEQIPFIKAGIKDNIGPDSLKKIEIVGNEIEEFICKDFKKVTSLNEVQRFLPSIFNPILKHFFLSKPVVNTKKCIGCKKCIEICPGKNALNFIQNKIKYNYDNCIRCYCCQEICPIGAITIKKPLLLKYSDTILRYL